jgi:hypothetical protein
VQLEDSAAAAEQAAERLHLEPSSSEGRAVSVEAVEVTEIWLSPEEPEA